MTRGRGILDLALVALAVGVVLGRTPIGGTVGYAVQVVRGADVPSLTSFFSTGMVAPALDGLVPADPAGPDGLPEPWRTAAFSALGRAIPRAIGGGDPGEALARIDAVYAADRDPQRALETAALGPWRERAVGRARAAGERAPEAYASYRRYLPTAVAWEADRFVGETAALATALDLRWPVPAEAPRTSGFGERDHPTLGARRVHEGVDLSLPIGTPVHAAQGGEVVVTGESDTNGRYITVDHGFGVRTAYLHLSAIDVAAGATVVRGQELGRSGNSGRSTGPHLHFGLQIGGRWVDPERFRR